MSSDESTTDRRAQITARLGPVLAPAIAAGAVGDRPIIDHVTHSLGFAGAVGEPAPGRVADLGSGGGVPALILALWWEEAEFDLIDSQARRTRLLEEAVEALGIGDRVRIHHARAEDAGRDEALRGTCDIVTSRSFGRPAVTAECGVPLLRSGGALVVSEPPPTKTDGSNSGDGGTESDDDGPPAVRWPDEGVRLLGLAPAEPCISEGAHFVVLRSQKPADDRYPRRAGTPARKPLW